MVATEVPLRIASYNIRKARGLDQKRRPDRILQVINRLDADIVVLQEADRRLGDRPPAIPREMIAAETDLCLFELAPNGLSLGFHGNAVLLRAGLEVAGVHHLDLEGLEPRGAVGLDLAVGDGLFLVAAHLGLRRRDRRTQLRQLRAATADKPHAMIAGDFNEWSRRRGLEPLEGRFETISPGHSYHARRPIAALDRFALTPGLRHVGGGVEQGRLARIASDHLPVWSDITVPTGA